MADPQDPPQTPQGSSTPPGTPNAPGGTPSTPEGEVDMQNAKNVNPFAALQQNPKIKDSQARAKTLSKSEMGYFLAWLLLGIIFVYILFIIGFLSFKNSDASSIIKIPDQMTIADTAVISKKLVLINAVQQEKKSQRDFVKDMSQMVLINILLPTLTAILGYIFGSAGEARKNE
jgi:uncharacterized membrane protein